MASTPTSHRGMDFGIAHDNGSQVQQTYASTARDDATELPVPDLNQVGIDSDQLPIISDRAQLQSDSTVSNSMGDPRMDSGPALPHDDDDDEDDDDDDDE